MTNKIYIESPQREGQYRRLARLGQKLGIPVPEAFLEMEVKMPDGRTAHHHKQRSHSWTRNGHNLFFCGIAGINATSALFQAGVLSFKNTVNANYGGTVSLSNTVGGYNWLRTLGQDAPCGYFAGAGVLTCGIVVGSGVSDENFENYVMQAPILHGTGAGQLSYAASEIPVLSWDAGTKTLSVSHVRYLNNNSAGDITINEVGLYGYIGYGQSMAHTTMVSRDKLGSAVVVGSTGQLKVTYTISIVYP